MVPVLFILYIQDVLKFKKNNSGAKRLITIIKYISSLQNPRVPQEFKVFPAVNRCRRFNDMFNGPTTELEESGLEMLMGVRTCIAVF